ncbi:glycoside hydrolase family 97 protein [Hymenobacter properus]|uniref:Glycoside hydrolase family 97 catalytic domain-containing protein n=1 Tax=Hymenobacter properus TaxID=2791026 RepID=A0A931BCH2_9BACT|nr:glycoside hydrolase family 97 protein [Hymenobacter properus]MBF9140749.1 glycoside hydrolase family 97 catalytic domain-containing protein [Hymenobacter properus]MBR7719558.1 glycoside hydrolase family 97 catalytic domain-containing protein [Microvirga sp. SRT04]
MRFSFLFCTLMLAASISHAAGPVVVGSPDGDVQVSVDVDGQGRPTYAVRYRAAELLRPSRLGLQLTSADLSQGLKLASADKVTAVADDYQLATDKRANCRYRANRRVVHFAGPAGAPTLSVVFQVSNDGVAFQYLIEGKGTEVQRITAEQTSFHLPADAKGWLHPHAKAQTGFANTQPSYEENYQRGIAAGTPSTIGQGWSFPALFEAGGRWVLLTEAGMGRSYCGSHLAHESPDANYTVAFPQAPERTTPDSPLLPESRLPWRSPWRVVVLGSSLAPIIESTLTTDLSAPATTPVNMDAPGKSSWSWVLMGDKNTTYDVQRRFIDYSAAMGWRYCLVDALWDTQIGYEKVAELAQYARSKNVGLLVWYNSNGSWNQAPQTPTKVLFDAESRRKEFARIKQMGVAGVKIDFFGGDGQSFMNYYQDLMTDAAQAGLLVNFHGATLPRGWNRTYPNLMTMEAVKGFEFLTFDQRNTDQEATHCATLPFTRNAVGPMDFTPMAFSEIRGKERRTSNAFELALAVLFQSGIQHYAEVPEGMAAQPAYVQDFVKKLPPRWADVRFVAGFPGEYAVLARQAPNGKWYLAGINATDAPKTLQLDLSKLNLAGGTLITDGATNRSFSTRAAGGKTLSLTLPARGGFVVQP